MRFKDLLSLSIVFGLLSFSSFAFANNDSPSMKEVANQQVKKRELKGKVVDKDNIPLPGVSVMVKGTTVGQVTDADGNYCIHISTDKPIVLLFSCIGMTDEEKKVGSSDIINITMYDDVKQINEVVVTGYFNKQRNSYTGAAKTYSAKELQKANPTNLLSALSIIDPSFKMVENNIAGSNPNVVPEFQIRGASSLPDASTIKSSFVGSPNMPTFIMDGFEVPAVKVFDMDPTRIESLTILKDAAATAIYGSRAANGVIVITTKQPKNGKLRLEYNVDLSANIPDLSDYHVLNAKEKLDLEKAAGYFTPLGSAFQAEQRMEDYNYRLGLVEKGYDTYWLSKPLRFALGQKHAVNISGGENTIRYDLDLTGETQPGVMKGSTRNKTGIGMSLSYKIKGLTFKNQLLYDNVKSINSPYGSFREYAMLNPYYPYKDKDGNYIKYLERKSNITGRDDVINPLYNTSLHTTDKSSYTEFVDNFSINWYINDAFQFKSNIAIRQTKREAAEFKPADHTDFVSYSDEQYYRKGYYDATSGKETAYDANFILSYFKNIEAHSINANVACNIQDESGDLYKVRAEGFQDDRLDYISFATQNSTTVLPQGEDYISRLLGFLMNFGYTYNNKYLLDVSARFDGSSKFGANKRWSPFWSVGLGWNMEKEKFMQNLKPYITELKLKTSYGITGSQSFSPYQSIIMYQYLNNNRYWDNIGATMLGLGNPDLKWQQTAQFNLGADLKLFNDRVQISASYYNKLSKGLLTDVTLPPSLGFYSYRENLGEVENKGFEFDSRFTVLRGSDYWVNFMVSAVHNKNTLKKLSNSLAEWNKQQDQSTENITAPKVRYQTGESINTIWGLPSNGINPANGKEIFIARNGELIDKYDVAQIQPIGVTDPKIYGNLGLDAGWKGLQLTVYFRYRLGGDEYNSTLVDRVENADTRYNTDIRVLKQRWQQPGDVTFFKDVKDVSYTRPSSRFVFKYNFIELSSLNLSYDFGAGKLKKFGIENLRLTFSTNNLMRYSTIKEERGLDYPFARTLRTSLRITF